MVRISPERRSTSKHFAPPAAHTHQSGLHFRFLIYRQKADLRLNLVVLHRWYRRLLHSEMTPHRREPLPGKYSHPGPGGSLTTAGPPQRKQFFKIMSTTNFYPSKFQGLKWGEITLTLLKGCTQMCEYIFILA